MGTAMKKEGSPTADRESLTPEMSVYCLQKRTVKE
jgi:hypothetical protein